MIAVFLIKPCKVRSANPLLLLLFLQYPPRQPATKLAVEEPASLPTARLVKICRLV